MAYHQDNLNTMKGELVRAQQKLQKQQVFVMSLEEQIARYEIAMIQKEINQINIQEVAKKILSHDARVAFFAQQRETLDHIIRSYPACRIEAQVVLDRILTMITQLSDQSWE